MALLHGYHVVVLHTVYAFGLVRMMVRMMPAKKAVMEFAPIKSQSLMNMP